MSLVLVAVAVVALWLIKQVVGMLISQQVKGSIPDYAARKAKAAARLLPDEIADEYEQDWLAELKALNGKPLSAIQYARGLPSAARSITVSLTGRGGQARGWGFVNRALDVNSSILLLIFLAPGLSVIGLMVKLDSRGPLLIRRRRLGKDGRPFGLIAFRTVVLCSDGHIHRSRVGAFLVRSSIVTLPALVNLLRGDISMIGPPPQRLGSEPGSPLDVRPGLTSWQALVEMGGASLSLEEARRRDRQRTLRTDTALIAQQLMLAFRSPR